MLLTVDTSVLLAVLLNEEHKNEIVSITRGHDLQAPKSLDAEIGNALSAMFKRAKIKLEIATEVIEQFEQIPIRRTNLRIPNALSLAEKNNIYAYDAYVLDCAIQFRTPLLSLDNNMIRVGKRIGLNIVEVTI